MTTSHPLSAEQHDVTTHLELADVVIGCMEVALMVTFLAQRCWMRILIEPGPIPGIQVKPYKSRRYGETAHPDSAVVSFESPKAVLRYRDRHRRGEKANEIVASTHQESGHSIRIRGPGSFKNVEMV